MTTSPHSVLDDIITSERLPSPSGVALQILELTRDENASMDDLGRVLTSDPALSGQILRYANSALARGATEARTVSEAVVRLGMAAVQQLALGFSLLSAARHGPCERFDYNRFWSWSLARAVAARCLAPLAAETAPDEAFTCGLLGRIGELCLASVHPRDYARVLARWDGADDDGLRALEQDVLLIDHDQVTAALMASWRLPAHYGEAVMAQPNLDEDGATYGLPLVLGVAQDLGEMCVAGDENRPAMSEALLNRAEALGLAGEDVVAACDRANEEWAQLGPLLDVITEDVPSLVELRDRARRQRQAAEARRAAGEDEADEPDDRTRGALLDPEDQPLRVLVVDDSSLARKIVSTSLRKEGHHVEMAEDGRQGLRVALQWRPHLIISDWMMPELDGLEMCRALRRSPETNNVYLIMLTSNDQNQDLVTALDAGADDYIPKPINHAVLVARLRAGARVIRLQERTARDREEIRSYAADLAVANRKLQHMALNDTLTGLPNRRYAMERLHKEYERARRHGTPFLCMLLDIDHFKRVNDDWGHDAGDLVLQRTAQVMKDCLRASDDVCRFGGEEFLCICPDADVSMAQVMGDRLRQAVENNHIEAPQFTGNVTVSVGAASLCDGVESIHDLLKLADEALYAAKEAGRNKVCIVDPEPVA